MSLLSEAAALHGPRYVVTIVHGPYVDCGCPHPTDAPIRPHEVVVKADATALQARAIALAWAAYAPVVVPAPVS